MKKLLFILAVAVLGNTSCKKEPTTTETTVEKETTLYSVTTTNTQVHWTAYKTSEKIPVKGVFPKK